MDPNLSIYHSCQHILQSGALLSFNLTKVTCQTHIMKARRHLYLFASLIRWFGWGNITEAYWNKMWSVNEGTKSELRFFTAICFLCAYIHSRIHLPPSLSFSIFAPSLPRLYCVVHIWLSLFLILLHTHKILVENNICIPHVYLYLYFVCVWFVCVLEGY